MVHINDHIRSTKLIEQKKTMNIPVNDCNAVLVRFHIFNLLESCCSRASANDPFYAQSDFKVNL